jgi:hypothetical protein
MISLFGVFVFLKINENLIKNYIICLINFELKIYFLIITIVIIIKKINNKLIRNTFVQEITKMSSLKWLVSLFIFAVADTVKVIIEFEDNIFLKIVEFNLDVESFL